MFFKKKYKYLLIIVLLVLIVIGPVLIHYVSKYRELSSLYKKMNYDIKRYIELEEDDYSKYFDVKTLTIDIKKIYVYANNNYEMDILYKAKSDNYYLSSYSESLALNDMKNFVYKWVDRHDYHSYNYKHSGEINGRKLSESITSSYMKSDRILFEYDGEKLILRSLPNYAIYIIIFYLFMLFFIIFGVCAHYIEKLKKENYKVECFFDSLSTISLYLLIYVVIGFLSGGIGFILLPFYLIFSGK